MKDVLSKNGELFRKSTNAWILRDKVVNEKGDRIDMVSHFFLMRFLDDQSKEIAVRKAAQVGISTAAILREAHDARFVGINQIHTLPTGEDVRKFVPSKVNEIIRRNKSLATKISKKDTDSVGQKQFGKAFLFYGGTKSEREAIMISSDRNIYDEFDFSDMPNVKKYESRLEAPNSLKQQWWISTPTIPNFGIDEKFNQSDQKYLRFNCPHCKHRQHFLWPESVDFKNGNYICLKCGGPIDNTLFPEHLFDWQIEWEAKYPGESISGYWIPQMIVPWKSAAKLIKEHNEAEKEGQLEYFYNFRLGMPYMSTDTKMDASLILSNLTDREFIETDSVAGVDVQLNELYVWIGSTESIYAMAKIVDTPEKNKWDRFAELMEVYNIRYCVIDAGFKPNDVLAFAKRFPHRVYMTWYKEDAKGAKIFRFYEKRFTEKDNSTFDEKIKVLIDREKAIDLLISKLSHGAYKFPYVKTDPILLDVISHFETMYARIVGTKMGEEKREWASTGKHDYVMAAVYFLAAIHRKHLFEKE